MFYSRTFTLKAEKKILKGKKGKEKRDRAKMIFMWEFMRFLMSAKISL